ncbi:N-acetyltransferase, putative [Plasmodium ovale]|uniref:N-acetyltransferase, putative n=2 Tax=Plasmodium ovale TaxID=36330 RepID=A0A1D3TJA4_PLAOA|nr:N-acetyltransferase, putative [Plasmodium ovale]
MKDCKKINTPLIDDTDFFKKSYLDVINKRKVLYKYIFLFNNYRFKFKIISTYYEYLIVCNRILEGVTACNFFFGPLLFFEMLGKSFYYPYVLYIYDADKGSGDVIGSAKDCHKDLHKEWREMELDGVEDSCSARPLPFSSLKFVKSTILDIDNIVRKGKVKNERYLKKGKNDFDGEKIILSAADICSHLKKYNVANKNIVGYTEIYLLFHMGRCFDSRIERLVIEEQHRNKGYGLLIMYICIYVLKYLYHCNRCDLNVENEIALRIYKKLKFTKVETEVYRLYLHCNYNFIPNTVSIKNDRDSIQSFMDCFAPKGDVSSIE